MDQRNRASEPQSVTGFWFFLLWAILCLSLFFWKIPPHPQESFLYLFYSFKYSEWTWPLVLGIWVHHGILFVSLAATLVVFCGIGQRYLAWQGLGQLNPFENWAWSFALGMGFLGLVAEGLAFENLLFTPLLKAVLVSAFVVFVLLDQKTAFRRCWPFAGAVEIPSFWAWPAALAALLSLSNLVAPEMSWDAITYQLVLPKFYFLKHGFYPVTGIVPSHYPSLGQMIFAWGLLWDDDSLARSFCFLANLGTALALVGIGSRLSSPRVGWAAAVFYWVFPYLNILSTRGYVDCFTGFYSVLGLGYLIVWSQSNADQEKDRWGILAAASLGILWALKYNAVSVWLAALAIVITKGRSRFRSIWPWLLGAPLFFFVPWALKSWSYTSNPFYPYLSSFFKTFDWTGFDAKASAIKFHIEGLQGLLKLPGLPWKVFFENYGGAPNEEMSLVPLVLFPVFVLFWVWKGKEIKYKGGLSAAIGIPFFFWLVTTHQLRLMTGTLALSCLPLALVYEWIGERWAKVERTFRVLMGVLFWVCAYYLFQGLANQPTPFACALGFQNRDEFLGRVLQPQGYIQAAQALNEDLPADSKVLVIGQQNAYYLDRISAYDFDYTYPVIKKWSEESPGPGELYKRFKENGFTHILYNSNGMLGTAIRVDQLGVDRYPWEPAELKNFEQFFLKFTRKIPLPVGNGYSLYEVRPREGFSELPEFLPGTEAYYLKNMQIIIGLPRLSDLVGKPVPPDVYLQTYLNVSDQHPEIGLPCFQWAIGALGSSPANTQQALKMAHEGFIRNGDEAMWDDLQGDACLVRKQTPAAVAYLERAQELCPERGDVARNLAVGYYNEHDLQKAVEEADRASALAPFSGEYQQLARQLHSLTRQ